MYVVLDALGSQYDNSKTKETPHFFYACWKIDRLYLDRYADIDLDPLIITLLEISKTDCA